MTEAVRLADKVAVRDYVRDLIGQKYLNQAYAVVEDPDDLDFAALPQSFIVKSNHGSGSNLVVRDKSQVDVPAMRRRLHTLLRMPYGRRLGEHWYAAIPPKLIAERLLVDRERIIPSDYRFHTFHGRVQWIQVTFEKVFSDDRWGETETPGQTYVDNRHVAHVNLGPDWQPAPFYLRTTVLPQRPVKPPSRADEMIEVAEKLAGDWGYVRVDLYCPDDTEIVFGELTFAHNSGLFEFVPQAYSEYFGGLWDIPRRYVRPERLPMPVLA